MWLRIAHAFGLTNLTDEQVDLHELLRNYRKIQSFVHPVYHIVEPVVQGKRVKFTQVYHEARFSPKAYSSYQRGHELQSDSRFEEALQAYRDATRADPECWEAHVQIGFMLCLTGRFEEARKKYLELIRVIPLEQPHQLSLSYQNLGWLEEREGHYKEALRYFRRAYEADQQNIVALGNVLLCEVILADSARLATAKQLKLRKNSWQILTRLMDLNKRFRDRWQGDHPVRDILEPTKT